MENNQKAPGEKLREFATVHKKGLTVTGILLALLLVIGIWVTAWLNRAPEIPVRPNEPTGSGTTSGSQTGTTGSGTAGSGTASGSQTGTTGSGTAGSGTTEPTEPVLERKKEFYTFVVAGTNDSYNTDTILVGGVDVKTHKVTVMSVPRDSMVDRDVKYRKINNAYGRAGVDEMRTELEELTGIYPDFYCVINLKAFTKIVNLVGGVRFYVPYDMYHEDGVTVIDLKQGWQTLDGEQALGLVRFRGTSANDFGRTQVQRDFIAALLEQVSDNLSISTVTGVLEAVSQNLRTNMDVQEMLWFFTNVVTKMEFSTDLVMTNAPVEGTGKYLGQDYVYLDAQGVVDTVNQGINPYTRDLTVEDLHIVNLKDQDY